MLANLWQGCNAPVVRGFRLVMSLIRYDGPPGTWSIPPGASSSFQGEDGELFRQLYLMMASTLVQQPPEIIELRKSSRGCYFVHVPNFKHLKKAFAAKKSDPVLLWIGNEDKLMSFLPEKVQVSEWEPAGL